MKESKKFMILAILVLCSYLFNIVWMCVTKDTCLLNSILAWASCIFWLIIFSIDRYIQLKKFEKLNDEDINVTNKRK